MKFPLLLLALAASSLLPVRAAGADDAPIVLPSNAFVVAGMPRAEVLRQLGEPDEALAPQLWVYWNFRAKSPALAPGADTLVVVFKGERVERVRLTQRAPVLALMHQLRQNALRKGEALARK